MQIIFIYILTLIVFWTRVLLSYPWISSLWHISFREPGPYAEGCGGAPPLSWANYPPSWAKFFKIMQFFTRNWLYIPNFSLKTRFFLRFAPLFVKTLKFTLHFSKVWYGPMKFIAMWQTAWLVVNPLTVNNFVSLFYYTRRLNEGSILTHISLASDQNAASDQGLHCLLTGISIRNKIKMKRYTRHPLNWKWTRPVDIDGRVH